MVDIINDHIRRSYLVRGWGYDRSWSEKACHLKDRTGWGLIETRLNTPVSEPTSNAGLSKYGADISQDQLTQPTSSDFSTNWDYSCLEKVSLLNAARTELNFMCNAYTAYLNRPKPGVKSCCRHLQPCTSKPKQVCWCEISEGTWGICVHIYSNGGHNMDRMRGSKTVRTSAIHKSIHLFSKLVG